MASRDNFSIFAQGFWNLLSLTHQNPHLPLSEKPIEQIWYCQTHFLVLFMAYFI